MARISKDQIPALESLFDDMDWAALLKSGQINQDEYDIYTDSAADLAFESRWELEVRKIASSIASEMNDNIDQARELRRRILEAGGIRSSDYEAIPAKYKRIEGRSMDDLATEIGFASDRDLFEAIEVAEEVISKLPRSGLSGKVCSRFRICDCMIEAEMRIISERGQNGNSALPNSESCENEEVPF